MKVEAVSTSHPISLIRTTVSWVVTATKVTLVASIILVSIYALYINRNSLFPPDTNIRSTPKHPVEKKEQPTNFNSTPLHSKTPVIPQTKTVLESPRKFSQPTEANPLPPNLSTPKKSTLKSPLKSTPTTNLHRTPLLAIPKRLIVTYQEPSSPALGSLSPTSTMRFYFDRLISRLTNPPTLSQKPIALFEDKKEIVVDEKNLKSLENFFTQFPDNGEWKQTLSFNPYLYCDVLERNNRIYSRRDSNDAARIDTLLNSYRKKKSLAAENEFLKDHFFIVYPVTFSQFESLEDFFNKIEQLPHENFVAWMHMCYEHQGDPLYWCYQLEKKLIPQDQQDRVNGLLDKYRSARQLIMRDPDLAIFFYMDPFTITLSDGPIEITGDLLLNIQQLLTTLDDNNSEIHIRWIEDSNYSALFSRHFEICRLLQYNPEVYRERPECDRELIEDLVKKYVSLNTKLNRRIKKSNITPPTKEEEIPLFSEIKARLNMPQFHAYLTNQSSNAESCFSFQEINSNSSHDAEVASDLKKAADYFYSFMKVEDNEAKDWLIEQAQTNDNFYPFYETFLLFNSNKSFHIPNEVRDIVPSLVKNYVGSCEKIKRLANEKTIPADFVDALIYQGLEDYLK